MLPLPEDLVAELKRTLDDVIRPTLTDHFAIEQAGLMSSLLEHLRLRIALEEDLTIDDIADIRATLMTLDEAVVTDSGARVGTTIQRLRAEDEELSQKVQDLLDDAEEVDDAESLTVLRALVRRQLDRQRKLIGPGYAHGT